MNTPLVPIVAAVVQCNAGEDRRTNRMAVARLVGHAAGLGARLVALPEMWGYYGRAAGLAEAAEPLDGPSTALLRDLATVHRVWLVGGSFPERIPGDTRVHNTCRVVSPKGEVVATYRKLHLFDVDVPGGPKVRESEVYAPGREVVVTDSPLGPLGLAICYDLRFPELFRALVGRGARALALPSAFTLPTGTEHWEPLVRARAIENQCVVLAPNQVGPHPHGLVSLGRSLIVDAWGTVLASCGSTGEGVACAALDPAHVEAVRARVPVLSHTRRDVLGDAAPRRPSAP